MKIFFFLSSLAFAGAIFLHCDFAFDSWSPIGNIYICRATPLDVSVNRTHVLGYYGTHAAGYLSSDVKAIWIRANCDQLTHVPRGLLDFFPNIVELSIHYCGISSLSGNELAEYPSLQSWTLHGTEVERIPGSFFRSTPEMAFIGFQNNKIKFIGEDLLKNLKKLQKVNFQENVCINKFATNASEIEKLGEELKRKCVDLTTEKPEEEIEVTTISNESTEINLEAENLNIENQILKANFEKLSDKFKDIQNIFGEIFESFNSRLSNLENKIQNCTCG